MSDENADTPIPPDASVAADANPPPMPPASPPCRRRPGYAAIAALVLFSALFAGLFVAGLFLFELVRAGPLAEAKTLIVPRGASVTSIAELLAREGIVRSSLAFRAASLLLAGDRLHAGEYAFGVEETLADILADMKEGRVVIRRFTVAEGLTSFEVVAALMSEPSLSGDAPLPPEGSLLPETYHYAWGDSRASLIERMQKSARELTARLWAGRAPSLPLRSVEEGIVLASVTEKETGRKAEERARVAGVFINRLRRGMRLQSDPTTLYAMTKGEKPLGRELTRADLATPSSYNTYTSDGLPPGPICNPGRAALEAAFRPEKHDYLYFVADGTGGHAFARTLEEHNRNVARWLGRQKDR